MSYDDDGPVKGPPFMPIVKPANGRDLDTIVTLLELAAIELTPVGGATFTREDLVRVAREYGIELLDVDINIVLPRLRFIKRVGGRLTVR